jgi:hypothetical protein
MAVDDNVRLLFTKRYVIDDLLDRIVVCVILVEIIQCRALLWENRGNKK